MSRRNLIKPIMDNLLTAISKIDEKYYHRHERDFAYEFYHQLRILKWPKNVEVSCEIRWSTEIGPILNQR